MRGYRLGIDIGGTFTDFALTGPGGDGMALHKHLTTPDDPARGALEGMDALLAREGLSPADVTEIVHGTTLVTNAIIERRGVRTGMITTRGMRDIVEMGIEQRYDIYDLFLAFPEPLVPRDRRLEVGERIAATGAVVEPLDEAGLLEAAGRLVAEGCAAVALCFLHAYRNPAHEAHAAAMIRAAHPGLAVSLSSAVAGEISEYPRFVTTCANAYVQPLMDGYLRRFGEALAAQGFAGAFRMMSSAGGLVPAETARAMPIRLLESGPAGGALATARFGRAAGLTEALSFDMGGTTAKACLIEDGRPHVAPALEAGRAHRFKHGSGLPIRAPVVDMIEIGAGGGSIAALDAVGLLKVGPRSAGADPGPACYGRGGTEPTVTDAAVALGWYDPERFLGGRMALDRGAAERALATLAGPLGLDVPAAAWGVVQTVAETMASAAQIHVLEKGRDPRRHALVGFGGAGPAFAAMVARTLGIGEVIVPPASGAASALGVLTAPLSEDLIRSRPMPLAAAVTGPLGALVEEMAAEGADRLCEAGVAREALRVAAAADMRLEGQLHEVTVPLPEGPLGPQSEAAIAAAFEREYVARYTAVPRGAALEILSVRVRVEGPEPALAPPPPPDAGSAPAPARWRMAHFGDGAVKTAVHDRAALPPGTTVHGPAIVEEPESTTVVPPGDTATVDGAGNLRIAVAGRGAAAVRIDAATPLADAMARIEADPIGLEIMWSRLVTVAEDMWRTVCRTAFSLIMSESQDFGCALLDPEGETIAHSTRVMPVFNITLPRAVRHILSRYPAASMREGDVYITNDPWECAGHLFDLAIVTPVFHERRVVALTATVGHVGDIGGTRDGLSAREVYEEGMQIPPMALVRAGAENEDLFRLLHENVRAPEQVIGDIRSLMAANARGAAGIRAFMVEYGLHDLRALAAVLTARSEEAMRAAIRALPDGAYRSEIAFNPMGRAMRIPVEVRVDGDSVTVDFEGAPPQVDRGGINCTLSYTEAHGTYPLKCMLTPGVRGNAGCYRPFTVRAPEGSILNCAKPAAVSLRTRTGWYSAPNLFRAMAGAAEDRVQAFSGLPSVLTFYGRTGEGRRYQEHLLLGGGQGASAARDGRGALLWPTSAATSSLELLEARLPILVLEKAFVVDSGGPGRQRGGPGTRLRVRRREAEGPMSVVVAPEGVDLPVPGLLGGLAGLTSRACVLDAAGRLVEDCGTGAVLDLEGTERILELVLSGGSGFGDPRTRDPEAVARDVRLGLVSARAAAETYGRAAEAPAVPDPATA